MKNYAHVLMITLALTVVPISYAQTPETQHQANL